MDRAERNGLLIALAGHVLLFGALSLGWLSAKRHLAPPEDAMAVDIVALESSAPEAAPVAAPEVGPTPALPPPEPEPSEPVPEPTPAPPTPAPPPPTPAPTPKPPPPKPEPKPAPKPAPPKPEAKPAPEKPAAKPAPPQTRPRQQLDSNWLGSVIGRSPPDSAPAALTGAQAASLAAALRAQIRPCWQPPTGAVEINQLVVTVRVNFARSGAVQGPLEVTERTGVNAANRAYLAPFEDAAKRAVSRCAPIDLPEDLYDHWKQVDFPFDVKLSRQ